MISTAIRERRAESIIAERREKRGRKEKKRVVAREGRRMNEGGDFFDSLWRAIIGYTIRWRSPPPTTLLEELVFFFFALSAPANDGRMRVYFAHV